MSYDAADNSARCYELAIRAAREKCIRAGQILPRTGDATEKRWTEEGPRKPEELETVRE